MPNLKITFFSFLLSISFLSSCTGQNQAKSIEDKSNTPTAKEKQINYDYGVFRGFLDSKGVLWFSNRGNGLHRFDGESFTNISVDDGLCDNDITSFMEDDEGNLWFGTPNGLCHYDRKSFRHVPIPFSDTTGAWLDKVYPVVNPNQVMSMLQDKNGDYWIGTNGAGVYKYDGKNFIQYLSKVGKVYDDGLHHNVVLSITEDLSGNIWFTSLSHAGATRFDGETFKHFKTEDGLSDNFIRTSYCDKSGNIWIGTHGNRNGGLDRFNGESFTNFNKKDGLCSNNVQGIFQDKSGLLWLASDRGNMCTYDGKIFKEFKSQDGQSFQRINCILEDKLGNIWFGGKYGLWRYDGEVVSDMTKIKTE